MNYMLDRESRIIKVGAICVSGILIAGAAGTTVYAKIQKTGSISGTAAVEEAGQGTEDKTLEEKLEEELKDIWQPVEEDGIVKEETVYIMANADGSSSKVIVSDWIRNGDRADSIVDMTGLADITEVKNGESYIRQNDGYVWQAGGNDIYYQGTTDKKLPLTLTVTYFLDGKQVKAGDLEGKSGHVVIRYDFTVNEYETVEVGEEQEQIYVPFTAVTGMILDNEVFRNVEVSSGKVINDGDRIMVTGIAFPGMAQNLDIDGENLPGYVEIEADVTDFSLKTTYCVAMNDLVRNLNLDDADSMDELTDVLDELTDAVDQLLDGSDQLYDGLVTLYDKSGELKKGVGDLYDGAGKLKDGAKKLADGTVTLRDGSGNLLSGAEQLQAGLGQLTANNDMLNGGARQVFETLLTTANTQLNSNEQLQQLGVSVNLTMDNYDEELNGILENMDAAVLNAVRAEVDKREAEITAGVTAVVEQQVNVKAAPLVTALVREQVTDAVLQGMQEKGYPLTKEQYLAAKQGTVSGNDAQAAAMDAMVKEADKLIEQQMAAQQDTIAAKTKEVVAQQMASEEIRVTIAENVKAQKEKLVSDNLAAMSGSLSEGAAQIAGLKQSLDSYNTFYQGLLTYTAGVASAKDGCDQLVSGTVQLRDGAEQLLGGVNDLYNGTEELYDGVGTLNDGSDALLDGVRQLKDGAGEMKDGLVKFDEEAISRITEAFDEEEADLLIDRLRAMVNVSRDYRSYAGIADDMEGNVKFIFKIEGIE